MRTIPVLITLAIGALICAISMARGRTTELEDPIGGVVRGTCVEAHINTNGPNDDAGACHSTCTTVPCEEPPPEGGVFTNAVEGSCEGETGSCKPNFGQKQLIVQHYQCNTQHGCSGGDQDGKESCFFTTYGPPQLLYVANCKQVQ